MKRYIFLFTLTLLFACSDDEGNLCQYQPTLTTLEVDEITEFTATLNGLVSVVSQNCDDPINTEQGFVYSTQIQPTVNDSQVNVNGVEISVTLENLQPNTTYYARVFLTNALGEFYGNEVSFTTEESCDVVYLADNGVTIKACEDATVGDTGEVNDIEYTIIAEETLRDMVVNGDDLTRVCTSKITDMSELFFLNQDNNQDISSWDVSNVTNMNLMFSGATNWNPDISRWNVSNVTDMGYMFAGGAPGAVMSFNQPIGDWDVSNVTYMGHMFDGASTFNQDISSWDVSNVTNMYRMFHGIPNNISFNQDLSSWSVDEVTECGLFSVGAVFWTLPKPNFTNCNPN